MPTVVVVVVVVVVSASILITRIQMNTTSEYYVHIMATAVWGTGIRGLMRGMATLPNVTRSY